MFSEKSADESIQKLLELKSEVERYFKSKDFDAKMEFVVHFGYKKGGPR